MWATTLQCCWPCSVLALTVTQLLESSPLDAMLRPGLHLQASAQSLVSTATTSLRATLPSLATTTLPVVVTVSTPKGGSHVTAYPRHLLTHYLSVDFSFNRTLYAQMIQQCSKNNAGCDLQNIARYRKQRYDDSVAHNGNFYFGPKSLLLYGAASFL